MIVFSDLHLQESSEDVVFNEVLPGIFDAAMKNDKVVSFLGDWMHIRYTINVRLFNRVRDTLTEWSKSGIRTMILPGNHDQINYEGRNALEAYADINNVEVFTNPAINQWGLWIPYRKDTAELQKALAMVDPKCLQTVVWIHHGVKGAMMNDFHKNTEGLESTAFKGFSNVFCGHYHKRQTVGNVTYVGSPWQTNFSEAGQPKGYGIWDGNKMEFVDTMWGKRFHRVELMPGDKLDLSDVRPQDEVRITTHPGVNADKIGKQLHKAGIAGVVTPQVEELESRLDVPPDSGLEAYAQAYVDALDVELNKERLMQVFSEVTLCQ